MKIDLRKKILLFDFDGTIVETEILAKEAVKQYFADKNEITQAELIEKLSTMIIGRTWGAAIDNMIQYTKSLGIHLDSSDVLAREFKSRYRSKICTGSYFIPGFLEVWPKIRAQAAFIGIVTGSERAEVESILKSKVDDFDRIWAVGDYVYSKPDPSPYLTALHDLQAKPEDVLVFEDSVAGMESAARAGLKWVQVCYEGHAKQADPRSIAVIRDWNELFIKE